MFKDFPRKYSLKQTIANSIITLFTFGGVTHDKANSYNYFIRSIALIACVLLPAEPVMSKSGAQEMECITYLSHSDAALTYPQISKPSFPLLIRYQCSGDNTDMRCTVHINERPPAEGFMADGIITTADTEGIVLDTVSGVVMAYLPLPLNENTPRPTLNGVCDKTSRRRLYAGR